MRDPQLCVTVTAQTMDELRRRRDAAAGADLVELRLDGIDRPDAAAALEGRLRPAIVTCRPRWEGGEFDGSEQERRQILLDAVAAGAERSVRAIAVSGEPHPARSQGRTR
jgi:3-dehydroquinate dehydratase